MATGCSKALKLKVICEQLGVGNAVRNWVHSRRYHYFVIINFTCIACITYSWYAMGRLYSLAKYL